MSMTESEAIKVLERLDTDNVCVGNEKFALEMAITALEEIQQYRAIGTVSEFRELKEKATEKKPSEIDERAEESFYYLAFLCPTCGNAVIGQPYRPNNCKHCGQKLDWSEGKE